jgi:hypothetical protein
MFHSTYLRLFYLWLKADFFTSVQPFTTVLQNFPTRSKYILFEKNNTRSDSYEQFDGYLKGLRMSEFVHQIFVVKAESETETN